MDRLLSPDLWLDLGVGLLAQLLEILAAWSSWRIFAIVALLLLVPYLLGHFLQRKLIRLVEERADAGSRLLRWELLLSVLALPAMVVYAGIAVARTVRGWLLRGSKRKKKQEAAEGEPKKAAGEKAPAKKEPSDPFVVATLGPTFFLAGLVSAAAYWLARLTDPLLGTYLGVSEGNSAWQYLLLGQRPELGWLLPLEDQPTVGLLLGLVFWLAVWWSVGNFLRLVVFSERLWRNLGDAKDALPLWYERFGVLGLAEPTLSYRRWATWVVTATLFLLGGAVLTFGRPTGSVSPNALALSLVVTLSWILHLRLRGVAPTREAPKRRESSSPEIAGAGWPEVCEELRRLYGVKAPEALAERPVRKLALESISAAERYLSPLLPELLPDSKLTTMQRKVLRSLALQGYVHLSRPSEGGALELAGPQPRELEDRSGLSERHQIVLAPEGSGKSTLGRLAAVNHALVHTRSTLWITRSEIQAKEACEEFVAAVEPSTLRWNVRVRQVGGDFVSDLSRNVVPDVVVCSLDKLVTSLLDSAEIFIPFLRNVGLIVVDDVESFAGGVEVHAQLAFRRLQLLFAELSGVEQLGKDNAPLMLVLGADSMKDAAAWVKVLCGIQASVRLFPHDPAGGGEEVGRHYLFSFRDLQKGRGRRLSVAELVGACESRGVPWHYRPCGDGRRHQGKGPLLLDREPELACTLPRDAAVVILEGRWSEVRRELRRLPWAGIETGLKEVSFLTILDPLEEEAFAEIDATLGLDSVADAEGKDSEDDSEAEVQGEAESEAGPLVSFADELSSLPLPIVRPPSSQLVQSHLLSDLLQHWIEVKDLVATFESPVAGSLRRLQAQGMLQVEERRDVRPELKEYESKAYVRALATSLQPPVEEQQEGVSKLGELDKVRQVELISSEAVAVRNRADHTELRKVEADSAPIVYYPGRVFEDSRGRFVVVGRASRHGRAGAIEVEPALDDDLSSPRRRFEIEEQATPTGPCSEKEVNYPYFPAEPVLLGRDPVALGLVAVIAKLKLVGTYRIDRITGEVRSREVHGLAVRQLFQQGELPTVALVLRPNPAQLAAGAPRLRFGEARLLAALLRFLLPLLYRDTRESVEVALRVGKAGNDDEGAVPFQQVLDPADGIYLLDLHRGGNGFARSLYRDGLELPLRFCQHLLECCTDLRLLLRLHDHWGTSEEILQEGYATDVSPPELSSATGHADEPAADATEAPDEAPLETVDESEGDELGMPEEAAGAGGQAEGSEDQGEEPVAEEPPAEEVAEEPQAEDRVEPPSHGQAEELEVVEERETQREDGLEEIEKTDELEDPSVDPSEVRTAGPAESRLSAEGPLSTEAEDDGPEAMLQEPEPMPPEMMPQELESVPEPPETMPQETVPQEPEPLAVDDSGVAPPEVLLDPGWADMRRGLLEWLRSRLHPLSQEEPAEADASGEAA